MTSKRGENGSKQAENGSKYLQHGSNQAQNRPKMTQKGFKKISDLDMSKRELKWLHIGSKQVEMTSKRVKMALDRPKMGEIGFKMARIRPKTGQICPKQQSGGYRPKNGLGCKWTISDVLLHIVITHQWRHLTFRIREPDTELIFNRSAPLWVPNKKIEKNF